MPCAGPPRPAPGTGPPSPLLGRSSAVTGSAGLGLGLSLARSIVMANGGVIEARNVAPYGAQFEVRLPLAAQPAEDRQTRRSGGES